MTRNHLVIDVESTGPCPGIYSMVQLAAVDLNGDFFTCKIQPISPNYIPEAMAVIGHSWNDVMEWADPSEQMQAFHAWITGGYEKNTPVVWSDNPAFDWQFVNYYLHLFCGENPLGFSMRRIGDLYSGLKNDLRKSSEWKRLRTTKHTHDALDDARGNAEALKKIFSML